MELLTISALGTASMKRHVEMDWINVVLQDVVDFLGANELREAAEIVAASAVSVRISLEAHPTSLSAFSVPNEPAIASSVEAFRSTSFGKA